MEHLPLGTPITIKPIVLRSIAVLLASLILIPTLLLILRPGTAAAWFDDSYAYRQKITFTHNANLTDASMRLTISNTDTLISDGKMQGDCDDSRFTDGSGKLLRFKLVSGCNSASTVYDVVFPTVLNGSNLAYFYYGNPSAVSASDASVPDGATPSGAPSFGSEEKGPSPALYLRFDEGYGTTAQDATANHNDGAVSGAAWQTQELCLSENCLFFDGTDDVVTVVNADSLDMDRALAGGLTYQAWVRVNSDGEGSAGQVFNKGTNTYLRITNEGADGSADLEASLALATSNATVTITDGIALNTWTHIALTYTDDTDDEITVYVNGVQKGTSINGSGAPAADSNNLLIGGPTTANFHGFLDEWKVYPVERTDEQIKTDTIKAASLHGTAVSFGDDQAFVSQGLVGYWKLDETSGDAADSSGNGVTLTNNSSTNYTSGKFGNAGWFNASSTDYFSTATTINTINTISFWASPSATTDEFINLTASAYLTASAGTVSFTGATDPHVYVNGVLNGTIAADSWNHIVAVTTTPVTADTFEVGRANSAYTNGKIDDVRLYNRTLSPAEIQRLYDWGPGPVGWWKLDENQSTSAFDASGNNNTGTLTNGPQWTEGKLGQALSFDGSNDLVSFSSISVNPPFTYSFWMNRTATRDGWVTILNQDNTNGFWFEVGVDRLRVLINDVIRLETGPVSLNTWYYITLTDDGVTSRLYVNGAEVDTDLNRTDFDLAAMGGHVGGLYPLTGVLDDVRLYNYALTQKQMVSVMNADHPAVGSPVGSAIAHYKFDEGHGTTANNAGNQGPTLNGTLTGMDSPATAGSGWTNNGKFGKALNFDGSNDFVDLGQPTSLNNLTAITVSGWANCNSTCTTFDSIASQDDTSTNRRWNLRVDGNTNDINFSVWIGNTQFQAETSASWTTSGWHHIVGTHDGAKIKIYVDGILRNTADAAGTMDQDSTNAFIGDAGGGSTSNFRGTLDEIKIYNYALSPDEIKTDYNQAKSQVLGSLSTESDGRTASNSAAAAYCPPGDSNTCNAPVAHWTLDENDGTTANDISGNANTGTLTNDPVWTEGKLGQAITFDGLDDYIDLPGTSLSGLGCSISTCTMAAWIKMDGTGTSLDSNTWHQQTIIADSAGGFYGIHASNIGPTVLFYNWDTNEDTISSSIALNQWHHVVWVHANGRLKAYVNGIMVGDIASGDTGADNDPFLGGDPSNTADFGGLIDDVRLYNYARTPAQIAWEYNQGRPIAHYKLDECTGITAYDSSGKNNHGTINISS